MKNRKHFFFCFFIFLSALFLLYSFFVINRKVQEERLLNDVNRISTYEEFSEEDFSSSLSSHYQEVESLIFEYMDSFYQQYDKVMSYADDTKLTSLLSVSNYLLDGKEFKNSLEYVEKIRVQFNEDVYKLSQYSSKQKIIRFSKKSSFSFYYQEVFVSTMTSSSLFSKLKDYKKIALESKEHMNQVLDVVVNTLHFLKENSDDWKVEDEKIQFSTEDLVHQYQSLVAGIS